MLIKRVATAAIGIPLVVLLIREGEMFFAGAVIILAAIALWELRKMAIRKSAAVYPFTAGLPAVLLCVMAYSWKNESAFWALVTVSVLLIMTEGIFRYKDARCFYGNLYSFYAVGYIGLLFSHIILLRQYDAALFNTPAGQFAAGEVFLWLALAGTWASDTFAYFIGTAFGKHKMCPDISPAKSWEGAAGGFIGCVAGVWLLGGYFFGITDKVNLWALGLLIALAAPLGDLAESQLKRFSGVKDSGNFFPGHGGVLDRLDSLLFVAPALYIYLKITFI